jgi:hypothetical protein
LKKRKKWSPRDSNPVIKSDPVPTTLCRCIHPERLIATPAQFLLLMRSPVTGNSTTICQVIQNCGEPQNLTTSFFASCLRVMISSSQVALQSAYGYFQEEYFARIRELFSSKNSGTSGTI